jgi:hypothetical protein
VAESDAQNWWRSPDLCPRAATSSRDRNTAAYAPKPPGGAPQLTAKCDPTPTRGNIRVSRPVCLRSLPKTVRSLKELGRIERADGNVVAIRISEWKLRSTSVGIYMWFFFQSVHESAGPWQSYVKVVDPEKQEETVARLGIVGAC